MKLFKLKYILVLAAVFPLLLISADSSVESQDGVGDPVVITKTVTPNTANPGDTVEVEIRVPGGSETLRNPADTMLVMDRSGSMSGVFGGGTKLEAAQAALSIFVDNTKEHVDVANPGDYVGLATYSTNASLDHNLVNMTAANKTSLKAAINSFSAAGVTSIGSGMEVANTELVDDGRAGVNRYMVLATDGRQNTFPNPYDNGILATTIAEEIVVFTVGIGNDVTTTAVLPGNCGASCPDPNLDGLFSGEEIMKDIACKTDQQRPDPADNCSLVWDETNDPAINDWDSPAHYYYADDPAKLNDVYTEIANEITSTTWYHLFDQLNMNIFATIIAASFTVTDCATGTEWPRYEVPWIGQGFMVLLGDVAEGEEVCITFQAIVSPAAPPGPDDVDQMGISAVMDPEETCEGIPIVQCLFQLLERPYIEIGNDILTIEEPTKPWILTEHGNVGSKSNIEIAQPILPTFIRGSWTAEFLVTAKGAIDPPANFTSLRDWEVNNYDTKLSSAESYYDVSLPSNQNKPGYDYYQWLWDIASKKAEIVDWTSVVSPDPAVAPHGGPNKMPWCNKPEGCYYKYDATFTITKAMAKDIVWAPAYSYPVVFFAKENIRINGVRAQTGGSPIIWVAGKNITSNVQTDDLLAWICQFISGSDDCNTKGTIQQGFFFANGLFKTSAPEGLTFIRGSIVANRFELLGNIGRNESQINEKVPSEWFIYDPTLLWYFREMLGEAKIIYQEVAP
jgi:hypothetical protein